MSIIERIQRIIKGNVNDVLDKLEEPATILKQRIRELEEVIKAAKEATASYGVSLKKMEKEQEQLKRLKAEWERSAEMALHAGDEETARKALAEKIKLEERAGDLEPRIRKSLETYKQLRDDLTPLHDQLAEAKLKLSELGSRQQAALAQKKFGEHLNKAAGMTVAGEHFDRMESKVLQAEAEVEIDQELRGDLKDVEASLAKKAKQSQVESELEALKKRIKP